MLQVLGSAWALLLGMMFLQVGNGMQGTLLGVRGGIEGFTTFELSIITSAYFAGFLGGSKLTPGLIRRVGHVRVFAALGSFISTALILYPTIAEVWSWTLLRVVIGFSFSGVYVVAESWLNDASDNHNRGKALSLYMIVQMMGIVSGQALLNVSSPAGFELFVIASVLVSISFAPILLSVSPSPAFGTTKPMSLRKLYKVSPTGFVGMTLLGGVFAAQFGMSAVYATSIGLSVPQISAFVGAIFMGAMVLQYPIGWMSDRMDRRRLIFALAILGSGAGVLGIVLGGSYAALLAAAFLMGGVSNPLYSLLIAYTNDFLDHDDMPAASGGLIFVNGLGAIAGPMVTGYAMTRMGPDGFWVYMGGLMILLAAYIAYRMTRRPSPYADTTDYDLVTYAPLSPSSSPIAVEVAQEVYIDNANDDETVS